jgi:outer membrane lipase/esterase
MKNCSLFHKLGQLFVFCLVVVLVSVRSAHALDLLNFDNLIVFGDSLSDNGNTFARGGFPGPPYADGRYSNGPIWVDYFPVVDPHFPIVSAFFKNGGTNFAVGFSTSADLVNPSVLPTATKGVPFPAQIYNFLQNSPGGRASANHLYVIWIGANDFNAGINPDVTVKNIRHGIDLLRRAGARTFVVVNVPDLALTPTVIAAGGATIQAARQFVFTVNVLLEVEMPTYALLHGVTVELVDINAVFIPLVLNPTRFGFTNSSGYALDPRTGGGDTNQNDYVFFDGFHPTTKVHCFAAQFIYDWLASKNAFPVIRSLPLGTLKLLSFTTSPR